MRRIGLLLSVLLPWPIKRLFLKLMYGYDLDKTAYIGLAFLDVHHLTMGPGAYIGHLNVAVHLHQLRLGKDAYIGRGNWMTGHPLGGPHFRHVPGRDPSFLLGEGASITNSHHVDCTDTVEIGAYATVAGYGTQFLSHGIDYMQSRQDCKKIFVGRFCLVGSRALLLGGAVLPSHSVLAAGSTLTGPNSEEWSLYAGHPAVAKKSIPPEARYFTRPGRFVS